MTHLELPDQKPHNVSFYLAMEEYAARRFPGRDCFFTWQVGPSVIMGRNQVAGAEVDTAYCRSRGIGVFRRKSGGGCVYADMGNVMLSYVTSGEAVGLTFSAYVGLVLLLLRKAGVSATAGGRNDIMVGGRKVSGSAFYHLPGRSIVHGTMLFDTDMDNMLHAITPPADKLTAKGVASVRQRIALLKDHTGVTPAEFRAMARRELCSDALTLTDADVEAIGRIESEYLSPEFIIGKNPPHTVIRRGRIGGVGGVEARVSLRGDTVRDVCFTGDFLPGDVPMERLTEALRGVRLRLADVAGALAGGQAGAIRNLSAGALAALLTEET